MIRKWNRDINKMNLTEEEKAIVSKVIDFTDSILAFDGRTYREETPSDTYYYVDKDVLMENFNYTYEELKKEGVFEEEEEAPADPWLKVLEDRVAEEEEKAETYRENVIEAIAEFKEWLNKSDDLDIFCNIEYKASQLIELNNCFEEIEHRRYAAKSELATYKEMMNL